MIPELCRTFVPVHGGSGIGFYAAPEVEEHAEIERGLGNVLQGGPLEPGRRALLVAGYAITRCILSTEVVLRTGEALLGSLAVPVGSLRGIQGHAAAVGIHSAEIVLRLGKTLLGSLAQPAHRFDIVAATVVGPCVAHAEKKRGARVAALGTSRQPRHIAGIRRRFGGRSVDGNYSCAQ